MSYIRPLTPSENYSDEPRSLYGINGSEVEETLEKLIDFKKFTWEILDYSLEDDLA